MMQVEQPMGHPNDPLMSTKESRDSVNHELDWLINKDKLDDRETDSRPDSLTSNEGRRDYRGTDIPPRSYTPDQQWEASSEEDHSLFGDDYGPTDDQQTAMSELQQLKLELGYIEEDPPVYDVTDRLKQLNQELAEDPTPVDDDRERSIKFKENLVDLVAPPPDYPYSSDEEDEAPVTSVGQDPGTPDTAGLTKSTDTPDSVGQESDAKGLDQGKTSSQAQDDQRDLTDSNTDNENSGQNPESQKEGGEDLDPVSPHSPSSQKSDIQDHDDSASDIPIDKMNLSSQENDKNEDTESKNDDKGVEDWERGGMEESADSIQNSHSDYESDTEQHDTKTKPKTKDEEKVLVEINGKFELLSREELRARGEAHLLPQDDDSPRSDSTASSSLQPSPPKNPRPKTAAEAGSRHRSAPPRRAQSASQGRNQVNHGSGLEDFNYTSPYALSPAQKKYLRYRQQQQNQKQREEQEKKKEENERKKQESNEIFEAWLSRKRRQNAHERQEKEKDEKEKKEREAKAKEGSPGADSHSSGSNEREQQDAFNAWLKTKQAQKRREQFMREQEKGIDEGWHTHSKEDSDKAFRRWLRKKNAEKRRSSREEHQKVRIQKLQERRTRKAMALVRAIKQSQSFRYVDYYGYRY